MRASAAVKHIQHVASLGLDSQIAIPEMLRVVDAVVPGAFNSFFWVDDAGGLTNAYTPVVIMSALEVFSIGYDRLPAGEPTFDRILSERREIGGAQRLHGAHDFSRSVLVNEVWRPYGIGCGLDLVLRDRGRPLGLLFVNREAKHSRFTAAEARALAALAPHFTHALTAHPKPPSSTPGQGEERSGVVVAHADGSIASFSADAPVLMFELNDRQPWPGVRPLDAPVSVPPPLLELLRRLARIRTGAPSAPATIDRRTRRGLFRARAYPQAGGDLCVFTLTQQLPAEIRMVRHLAGLDLSPRERQVAYHLGMGSDADGGAQALGVSIATWRSYVKRIYERLEIGSRVELHTLLDRQGERLH
ncbi:response regulator transcription factor [Sphingomonas sp.]|uniref:response regulator transcription factor n=1 Tax=Sphingomonas sp. TaxID=28214 RepID=UPI003AFF8960